MTDSWFASPVPEKQGLKRSPEEQRLVDAHTANMALYHYDTCIFCAGVRETIGRLSLKIALRDIHKNGEHFGALIKGGGRGTVPCLYVSGNGSPTWMYESRDIVRYLTEHFGDRQVGPAS